MAAQAQVGQAARDGVVAQPDRISAVERRQERFQLVVGEDFGQG